MISIIVPAYNVENYLEACVASVISEQADDYEVIIVDDGSTDGTPKLCDKIALSNERISVVHKANGGLSSARNAGIDVAKGDYLMFLDGDDTLTTDALDVLQTVATTHCNADFIQFLYEETDEVATRRADSHENNAESHNVEIVTDRHNMFERLLLHGGVYASACTKLIKRAIFDNIRFTEGIKHEDEDFTTKLLSVCGSVAYLDATLYLYYMRQGSLIKSAFSKRDFDAITVRKQRIELLEQMGYDDLAESFTAQLFTNCCILYDRAKAANDKESCRQLIREATSAAKAKPRLNGQMAVIATALRCGFTAILPIIQSFRTVKHVLFR